jgi:2-hydroxy-6-oxonona-2,4-dienedioate hydrolase
MNIAVRTDDRFVKVDGCNIRYLEEGTGVPAILLHGSSLGSSADVFRRNLHALGRHGIRAIAVDLPGFGKSDAANGLSASARKAFVLRFMDALGLERAALIGHSAAGSPVVSMALEHPGRVSHVMILGTGSLLPPLETAAGKVGGRGEAAQARLEERMVRQEPTLEDTRALLEANLFHHELITPQELELRHQNSIGRCFEQFVLRHAEAQEGGPHPNPPPHSAAKTRVNALMPGEGMEGGAVPLWQRLVDLKMPLLLIYGRQDRARAAERATLLHERYPQLDLHFAEGCKHLVPWDAAELFHRLAVPFLTR